MDYFNVYAPYKTPTGHAVMFSPNSQETYRYEFPDAGDPRLFATLPNGNKTKEHPLRTEDYLSRVIGGLAEISKQYAPNLNNTHVRSIHDAANEILSKLANLPAASYGLHKKEIDQLNAHFKQLQSPRAKVLRFANYIQQLMGNS